MIDGLVDEGTLATEPMPRALAPPAPDPSFAEPEFSRQQRTAVDAMRALAANGSFHVALLDETRLLQRTTIKGDYGVGRKLVQRAAA